ncbi:MAG: hypothetical protein E7326_07040 [Clostridiales bacterium]|nr:hypothetical protein [Clostridiales bacterium]
MADILEALLSIVIIGLAVYSRKRKKKIKAKVESIRREVMQIPSDHLPDMRPVPVQTAMVMEPVAEKKPETVSKAPAPKAEPAYIPEGVDPCHDDMYEDREEPQIVMQTEDKPSPAAQELVRGFVLGEILGSPKCRTASRN